MVEPLDLRPKLISNPFLVNSRLRLCITYVSMSVTHMFWKMSFERIHCIAQIPRLWQIGVICCYLFMQHNCHMPENTAPSTEKEKLADQETPAKMETVPKRHLLCPNQPSNHNPMLNRAHGLKYFHIDILFWNVKTDWRPWHDSFSWRTVVQGLWLKYSLHVLQMVIERVTESRCEDKWGWVRNTNSSVA